MGCREVVTHATRQPMKPNLFCVPLLLRVYIRRTMSVFLNVVAYYIYIVL